MFLRGEICRGATDQCGGGHVERKDDADPAEVSRGRSTGGIGKPGRAEHQASGTLVRLEEVTVIAAISRTRASRTEKR